MAFVYFSMKPGLQWWLLIIFKSRTRTFNDKIFFKKFESKQTKKISSIKSFSNKILEHFFKIVQKISQNLSKLVLKKTPSKPFSNFKYAIIKGEYKLKMFRFHVKTNLSFSPKSFSLISWYQKYHAMLFLRGRRHD